MLSTRAIRAWQAVHKWTSLLCTVFLLMLALTGLPLIFHDELDEWLGDTISPPAESIGKSPASLDHILTKARETRPDLVVRYFIWDPDEPGIVKVNMAVSMAAPRGHIQMLSVDEHTGEILNVRAGRRGIVAFILQLHTDMFVGLPGALFLGSMGVLFVASIVSGIVLYAPFMRRHAFGTVRYRASPRIRWLDWHNLIGIVTAVWCLVVGVTGAINTIDVLVFQYWRNDQLAAMIAPYKRMAPLATIGSVDTAVAEARRMTPGMKPSFVAFPGSFFSSQHHFTVFMQGATPMTAKLLLPVLIDAETLKFTDMRQPPWYVATLQLSRPLHFGDYGGLPLKIIWALLDIALIVVLGSGLYLWWPRSHRASSGGHKLGSRMRA